VSEFEFLSPDLASPEAEWRSPLERALAHAPEGIEDVSRTGKLEVRGTVDALDDGDVVRLSARRALVLCPPEEATVLRARLRDRGYRVVDQSAGLAGLRVRGEGLLRRLTDLDLDELPAVGALAHVQAFVLRDDEETFRLFFPQEYGHYVAEVVVDAAAGLGAA
jgi:sarcosine oxidase gamma subunit